MITNKDIRVENGFLIINGDKFPLDGQSPETIMEIVEDNSDTTPTENSTSPVTSGGLYNAFESVDEKINKAGLTLVENGKINSLNTSIEVTAATGVYFIIVAQGGSNSGLAGFYMVKITPYETGSKAYAILTPTDAVPTISATHSTSESDGKIAITSTTAGFNYAVFKANITLN